MSRFPEEALKLVRLGYHVFQCLPRSKFPNTETAPNGCVSASGDPEKVRDWWTRFPHCNIGLLCDNVLVIDVDNKDGKDGSGDFATIMDRVGTVPDSPISLSGNGGYHLLFQRPDADIKGTNGLVWDGKKTGIDIQVGNQYIVVPPSIHPDTKEAYRWHVEPCAVTELPVLPNDWVEYVLPKRLQTSVGIRLQKTLDTRIPEARSPKSEALHRCRLYLEKIPPCIAGQGGDTQLYATACAIFWDFGLSEDEGMTLLREYNMRCLPPWPESRLIYKMNEALKPDLHDKPRGHKLDESKIVTFPEVDLSGITNQFAPREDEEPEDDDDVLFAEAFQDDPGYVPDELLRIPGFVSEVMDFSLANAPVAVPTTAFCGAVALQSYLCGRKVREPGDLRTNLYLLALVGASSGKDFPRKVNTYIMEQLGEITALGDKFVSGEGLQDALFMSPNMLYQNDEIDELLYKLNDRNRGAFIESIMGTLLTLYTSASTIYPMRRKSGKEHPGVIDQPHLTIFGTATPQFYYAALSERMMSNGFFARMIIVDTEKRPFSQDAGLVSQISERVLETARWWRAFQPGDMKGNLGKFHPSPITIPFDDPSKAFMRDFRRFADEEYSKAEDRNDTVAMTVWGRANENARKLALIYACSENHQKPEIALPATQWATEFVTCQIRRQLFKAKDHSAKTKFQALCKEALRQLRQWHHGHGKRGMPSWILRRQLGVMPREYTDLLVELDAQRYIRVDRIPTKGRPKETVTLLGIDQ
ncbi:MAG: bifunctional DNA primase/polymerase [Planctomycetaceae bacterium]|nr:bifunctional DNA primase/polymerase [Planctomycetaceae bacterium]